MRRSMPRPPATPPPGLGRLDLLRAALRASAATSDAALAVQFFRARPAGAGFLTADEAQAAVADYDDNRPGWRRALLEEAACVCTQGLPVYAGMAPPLGDLDWSVLPMDVDRKSVVLGKRVSVRVDLGGRRDIKKK